MRRQSPSAAAWIVGLALVGAIISVTIWFVAERGSTTGAGGSTSYARRTAPVRDALNRLAVDLNLGQQYT